LLDQKKSGSPAKQIAAESRSHQQSNRVGAAFSHDGERHGCGAGTNPALNAATRDIRSFKKDSQQLKWQHPKPKSNL